MIILDEMLQNIMNVGGIPFNQDILKYNTINGGCPINHDILQNNTDRGAATPV